MAFYEKFNHSKLKYKFKSSEDVEVNYSHAFQDMFVLTMLNGKRNGVFLEIGSKEAIIYGNNTYLLESKYGWNGISIDIVNYSDNFKANNRSAVFVCSDALIIDFEKLFIENNSPNQMDYLSLDIEPANQTLECLKRLPLDKYRFSVITYETEFYNKSLGEAEAERVRSESRNILLSHGYELVVGNLGNFEDWYVDPLVVDENIIKIMKESSEYNLEAQVYMYDANHIQVAT